VAVAPPHVEARGVAAGDALLRILEPKTGQLYDRIDVHAAEVERMVLLPMTLATSLETPHPSRPVVLWGGSTAKLVVALEDAAGTRLVDEGLMLEGGQRRAWDSIAVDGPTDFTATTSAGLRLEQRIATTTTIDDIVAWTAFSPPAAVCFRALSGGALVVGAPWQLTGPAIDPSAVRGDCVTLRASGLGSIAVDIVIGDFSRTVEVSVSP
jgi:hypothetical protein